MVALGISGACAGQAPDGLAIRAHVVWGAAAWQLAIVLASLFNVVRFGSVLNTNYLDDAFPHAGNRPHVGVRRALLVSPSGGIFVFWLSATVLCSAACVLPFVSRPPRKLDARPALVLIAICLDSSLASPVVDAVRLDHLRAETQSSRGSFPLC